MTDAQPGMSPPTWSTCTRTTLASESGFSNSDGVDIRTDGRLCSLPSERLDGPSLPPQKRPSAVTSLALTQSRSECEHALDHEADAFEIVVCPSGSTVWINGPDGACIGRFSRRFGIDVHRGMAAQMAGEGQCLFCTHQPAGEGDWLQFCDAMQRFHGIHVPSNLIEF